MKKNIPLVILALFFIVIKILSLGVRLSDTNIYFNLAQQIFQGKLIYRDLFFANFPFFTYVASFYYLIVRGNISLFYLTAALETLAASYFTYLIVYEKTKNYLISLTSFSLYLFSFIILSTSDHQTGVSTATLLAVLGFYFLQKKKFFISGIFVALSVLTKAYFVPIAFAFLIYLSLLQDWGKIRSFFLGLLTASLLSLLPFLIQAPKQFFFDIFGFSLTRPAGALKTQIAWFFITRDFVFLILLFFNLLNFRKNIFFGLISLFAILFFFIYQDIYYLYLNFLIPFLCLSFYEIYNFMQKKINLQKLVIPSIVYIFLILNIFIYLKSYRNFQKVNRIKDILSVIKKEKPDFLYGVNDLTPALLSLTKIPALNNVQDAHVYFFRKNVYDKRVLTKQATLTKTIIIAHGAFLPEFNAKQDVLDNEILDKEVIDKNCKIILSSPVLGEGATNRINLFKCY